MYGYARALLHAVEDVLLACTHGIVYTKTSPSRGDVQAAALAFARILMTLTSSMILDWDAEAQRIRYHYVDEAGAYIAALHSASVSSIPPSETWDLLSNTNRQLEFLHIKIQRDLERRILLEVRRLRKKIASTIQKAMPHHVVPGNRRRPNDTDIGEDISKLSWIEKVIVFLGSRPIMSMQSAVCETALTACQDMFRYLHNKQRTFPTPSTLASLDTHEVYELTAPFVRNLVSRKLDEAREKEGLPRHTSIEAAVDHGERNPLRDMDDKSYKAFFRAVDDLADRLVAMESQINHIHDKLREMGIHRLCDLIADELVEAPMPNPRTNAIRIMACIQHLEIMSSSDNSGASAPPPSGAGDSWDGGGGDSLAAKSDRSSIDVKIRVGGTSLSRLHPDKKESMQSFQRILAEALKSHYDENTYAFSGNVAAAKQIVECIITAITPVLAEIDHTDKDSELESKAR